MYLSLRFACRSASLVDLVMVFRSYSLVGVTLVFTINHYRFFFSKYMGISSIKVLSLSTREGLYTIVKQCCCFLGKFLHALISIFRLNLKSRSEAIVS